MWINAVQKQDSSCSPQCNSLNSWLLDSQSIPNPSPHSVWLWNPRCKKQNNLYFVFVSPQATERAEDKACCFRFSGLYFFFLLLFGKDLPAVQSRRWISNLRWMLAWSIIIFIIITPPSLLGKLVSTVRSPPPVEVFGLNLAQKRHLYTVHLYLLRREFAAKYNYCLEF